MDSNTINFTILPTQSNSLKSPNSVNDSKSYKSHSNDESTNFI